MNGNDQSDSATYVAFAALDWADQEHAVSLSVAGSKAVEQTTLKQTPEALAQWASCLRERFPGGKIAVALEQARGALIFGLMQFEHLVLYPVNPKSLARFREALYPSRSKDDPVDADLLLDLLVKHREHLRAWQPDTVETRQLALLNEQRRHFVDDRTRLTNQLLSHLKMIFPQATALIGDLGSALATDFLKKWPTLQLVQKVKPAVLRKFYYGHNSRSEKVIEQRLALIKDGVPLTKDPALLTVHSLAIQTLAAQLEALRPCIEEYERQIKTVFAAHPDAAIFESLPGAGAALAPRLLTALGTDRSRFPDALSVSCYSGIAPVTEKSGRTQNWIHIRWNCPKFLRQSWHEFAGCSIQSSDWANACYEQLRKRMDHHEAIRKLAHKWQRIVWRMWQKHELYNEARYIGILQRNGLKAYAELTASAAATVGE
jgi:transposase